MGTAAVFAFAAKENNRHYKRIIGMTSDGFHGNLIAIAHDCKKAAKELRCWTKFKKNDFEAVRKVADKIVEDSKGWMFVDNIDNASWVSHSAIYDPKVGRVKLYDGNIEDFVKEVII